MNKNKNQYTATITGGGFLYEETDALLPLLQSPYRIALLKDEKANNRLLKHRMDTYTTERVRSNYLLHYIEFLQNQIGDLESPAAALTTTENRKLTNLRKSLDECQEYHEFLQVIAEQAIDFDLDDGVIVNYAKFGDVLMKIKQLIINNLYFLS